jgi:hypothetical protein
MAAPAARKEPAPPSASDRLATAQAALAEANAKLAELNARRNECLLKDDIPGAIELGAQIASLKLAAEAHADRIAQLREKAAQEDQARRAQERERVIESVEQKLAARDAVGRELADSVAAADRVFRKLIDIGVEVQAAWPWPPSDIPACLLNAAAISHALSGELYRIGGRPWFGGGQVEPHGSHAGINFPGAKAPRFELTHLPERIPALTTALAEATAHASNIMRGKRPSGQVDVPVATNGNANAAPITNGGDAPVASGQQDEPARTARADRKLGALLRKLAELEADLPKDPARKAEYDDVVAAIAQVTAEQGA